jgi:murein DD-endopeptidase MepM/ murein hydrolase activator NlpD
VTRARRLLVSGLTLVLLFAISPPVGADDLGEDLQSVRKRISSLSDQIDSVTSNRSSLAREIQETQERMDEVLASLTSLRGELLAVESDLVQKERSLRQVRTDLHAQYQSLAMTRSELGVARDDAVNHAVATYMSAGLGVPAVALSARVWTDIAVGLVYLDRITEDGTETVQRFETLLVDEQEASEEIAGHEADLSSDLLELHAAEERLARLQNEMHNTSDALQEEYLNQRSLLAEYDAQIEEIEGEIASLEKEQASIKKLIAQQAKALGSAPGTLARPVPGAISSGFGPRIHPIHGYSLMHNGIDMNGGSGQAIVSAASGTVIFASVKGGYGNTIMVDHGGGMVTLYAHQSKFAVSAGQSVKRGQTIGYVGSTGVSTGPHLHFEVRIGGNPVNPAKYL